MLTHVFGVALATSLLVAGAMPAAASPADPIRAHLWRQRILLISAPSADDKQLEAQRQTFAAMKAGARERDLALVELLGDAPGAQEVRARFGIDGSTFRALLIGKDGGEKLASATPLGPDDLFPTIDAMPMRQDEMRRKR